MCECAGTRVSSACIRMESLSQTAKARREGGPRLTHLCLGALPGSASPSSLSWSTLAAVTKCDRLSGLRTDTCFSQFRRPEVGCQHGRPRWGLSSWLAGGHLTASPRGRAWASPPLLTGEPALWHQGPTLRTALNLQQLLEGPVSNAVTWGMVRASIFERWGTQFNPEHALSRVQALGLLL